MNGITIVLCCYNSSLRLAQTLKHLELLETADDFSVELLIVDNNSTDETVSQIKVLLATTLLTYKIIHEYRQGQIYAREAGVREACYDYLIFCDDDNWLCQDYLIKVYRHFETSPSVGAIGGKGLAAFEDGIAVPAWFAEYQNGYAVGEQAAKSEVVNVRGFLWGAGLAVRKEILNKCFDPNFPFLLSGRSAGNITSGDDSEICRRILLCNADLYYDSKLSFQHFIPANRLTDEYFQKLTEGFKIHTVYFLFMTRF